MAITEVAERPAVTPWALGAFFVFATVMALVTAITLLAPGGPLDALWAIKPGSYAQLRALGPLVGMGFLGLSAAAAIGSIGLFRRRVWGWRFAVGAIGLNGLADAARIPFGALLEGAIGVTLAGAILWWLTRPRVRRLFAT